MKTTRSSFLVLHVFKGEKCQSSNQEKIGKNPLLVLFFFTGPIILAKGIFDIRCITFKNILLKNACTLEHSNADICSTYIR